MLTLIKNAEIFTPRPLGCGYLLLGGGKILLTGVGEPDFDTGLLTETVDMEGSPV